MSLSFFLLGFYCGALVVLIAVMVVALVRAWRQSPHSELVEADTSGALIHLLACEGAVLLRERAK